jgi:hypothetical protein
MYYLSQSNGEISFFSIDRMRRKKKIFIDDINQENSFFINR